MGPGRILLCGWRRVCEYFPAHRLLQSLTILQRWGDIATAITKIAFDKGYISSDEVDKVSPDEAAALHPWGPLIWGGNSRGRSDRLQALGWKPQGTSVYESLASMVDAEAKTLGSQSQKTTFDL